MFFEIFELKTISCGHEVERREIELRAGKKDEGDILSPENRWYQELLLNKFFRVLPVELYSADIFG